MPKPPGPAGCVNKLINFYPFRLVMGGNDHLSNTFAIADNKFLG